MKKTQLFLRLAIFLPLSCFLSIMMGFTGLYLYLTPSLPSIDQLKSIKLQVPLRIYSKDHQLISEFGEKRRTPVSIKQVPIDFINAIKAAEDDNFEQHYGIDLKGLLRAAVELILTGKKRSGGSTITMQVAKNYFLSPEKTFKRKFIEIMLALHIEQVLSKEDILELYINKIYLGKRAYGIEAAANIYYGASIQELNLAQLAMIAGLPKAPSSLNPINNPERALERRNYILSRMYDLNMITQSAYQSARNAAITAKVQITQAELEAGYVAELVRADVLERFPEDAYTGGYQVITTIDSHFQRPADNSLRSGLLAFDQQHGLRITWPLLETRTLGDSEQPDLGYWLTQLKTLPDIGPLIPACVVAVAEKQFSALLKTGKFVTVEHFDWARQYEDINHLGPEIKDASQVVVVGHQIWVTPTQTEHWQLAQPPAIQGALISLDPQSGAVNALVGGFDFATSKFNRATQADRQPGSSFKPFVYSAALEAGMTPATLINDAPVVFEDANLEDTWRPRNASGQFYGPTRLRKALYKSRNLVTIRVAQQIGVAKVIDYVSALGFPKEKMEHNLSLALGAAVFTPLEMTAGYAILANGGYRVQPYIIEQIRDHNDRILYQRPLVQFCDDCDPQSLSTEPGEAFVKYAPRVMEARINYQIYSMMQDVITKGTGRKASKLQRPDLAGKTGTTNNQRDTWFAGFTPKIVTTVWVGFDDNAPLGRKAYGGTVPLPIWIDFMKDILPQIPEHQPIRPSGLVTVLIDPETGLRAPPKQKDAIFELFREENVPQKFARLRQDDTSTTDKSNGIVDNHSDMQSPERLF